MLLQTADCVISKRGCRVVTAVLGHRRQRDVVFESLLRIEIPVVIGEFLVKEIQLFRMPLSLLTDKIMLLGAYIAVLFVVLLVLAKLKNKRRE